jgi:hypothetical protein
VTGQMIGCWRASTVVYSHVMKRSKMSRTSRGRLLVTTER